MSGVTLTGIELFQFYLPIYGRSIGLAPSVIGMILSSYAVAGFIVRSFMHRLAQRYTEVGVLTGSLFVAASPISSCPAWPTAGCWRRRRSPSASRSARRSRSPSSSPTTTPRRAPGEALGMRIMANKVTQIAVPLAFGGFGAAMGAVPVFLATAVFLLVAGLISLKGGSE